jgi:hypothetical protein
MVNGLRLCQKVQGRRAFSISCACAPVLHVTVGRQIYHNIRTAIFEKSGNKSQVLAALNH